MRVIVEFGEFIRIDFENANKKNIEDYSNYLISTPSDKKKFDRKLDRNEISLGVYNEKIVLLDMNKFLTNDTKCLYLNLVKRFYVWYYNQDNLYGGNVLELVENLIRPRNKKYYERKTNDEVLTPDEFKLIIQTTQKTRDKPLILSLYESANRISEHLSLNIQSFEDCGNYGYLKIRYSKRKIKKWKLLCFY
jgi:integrase